MPTFNQLVRKGRDVLEVKSTAPALQKGRRLLSTRVHRRSVVFVQQ